MMDSSAFLRRISRLKLGVTAYGKAPHKPILLLSLLGEIDAGRIINNQVYITPELISAFKENFALLVETPHNADFYLPFYHLMGDGFWHIRTFSGEPMQGALRSFRALQSTVQFGYFDDDVWELLFQANSRTAIRTELLKTYFPQTKDRFNENKQEGKNYIHSAEKYILNESPVAAYAITDNDEETQFVRSGLFKKLVPQIYNQTCCISEMRIIAGNGATMIDACHIVPFSIEGNDKVTNGIALCPNLHRAFDRGLLAIDDNFRVLVSSTIADEMSSPYNIQQFAGKSMLLPFGAIHYPDKTYFAWHREHVFVA